MAVLHNDSRSLRFRLVLADREVVRPPPGQPEPDGRVLGAASVEHFDRRDGEFWPFVRLPSTWLMRSECLLLVERLEAVIRGELEGLAFAAAAGGDLGLQIGRAEGGRYTAEVGVDLAAVLREHAGVANSPGESLALFRFGTTQAELVAFGHALRREFEEVLAADHGFGAAGSGS